VGGFPAPQALTGWQLPSLQLQAPLLVGRRRCQRASRAASAWPAAGGQAKRTNSGVACYCFFMHQVYTKPIDYFTHARLKCSSAAPVDCAAACTAFDHGSFVK